MRGTSFARLVVINLKKLEIMKKLLMGSLVCSALLLGACNGSSTETTVPGTGTDSMGTEVHANALSTFTDSDRDFAQEAARGGKMEVALGNIAEKNSTNQNIKDFGKMMVEDHSAANSELTTLLKNKGVAIDEEYTNDQKDNIDKLGKESGNDFNKDYVDLMVKDHKDDIDAFQKASQNADDPDLKAWASKTIPTLQKHLDAIQKIQSNMK